MTATPGKIYHTVTRVKFRGAGAPQLCIRCQCGFQRIAPRLATASRRKAEREVAVHIEDANRAELAAIFSIVPDAMPIGGAP